MQKISLQKRSFFNSIGLDTNNLPVELQIKSNSMQTKISNDSFKFLSKEELTIPKEKAFRLKNLFGTDNENFNEKTWIDIFSENPKTDEIIKLYFNNPNYYYKDLKRANQAELNNNVLELYEDNGKFFIKDGVARLSLTMIKYLLEMSRAQSKEEKAIINKQYTFVAMVRSTPKDVDIMYLINMLYNMYGSKVKIKKLNNENESSYILIYDNKKIEFNSKDDIENFIRNSFLPKEIKSYDRLKLKLKNIAKIGLDYKENEDNDDLVNQFLVMGKIFPNYEIFIKYYKRAIKYEIEDKLVESLDINNISYDNILKKLIKIVKQEEINMSKLEIKDNVKASSSKETTKKATAKKENVKKETTKKDVAKKTSSVKSTNNMDVEVKTTQKVPGKVVPSKAEKEELTKKIEKMKATAASSISNILDNIEMTYYKLKTEEAKSLDLANSTGIELNIDKINDESINSNINSIKQSSFIVKRKIENTEELDELNFNQDVLNDLKNISNDKSIVSDYSEEMNSIFTVCFNKNARKMITDSKLKKLDIQRKEIENEKCSFFSKLIGKAKLKQAKLDNINLKEQLILTESQFSSNSYTTLEDGLSEIYAYIKTEDDASCLSDVKIYLKNVEANNQIKNMIDQNKLTKKTREKIDQQRNLPQLVLSKEKKKLFSKAQINLVQEKNNELKRVIQINRANSLKMQNTGIIPILGNIKSTRAVKKFISNLGEIDSSFKTQTK